MNFSWAQSRNLQFLIVVVLCIGLALAGILVYKNQRAAAVVYQTSYESDPYVRFEMEIYDTIAKDFWKKSTDADIAQFFALSAQKAQNLSTMPPLATSTRTGTAQMLATVFDAATSTEAKRALATQIATIAMYNLPPVGRDQLVNDGQKSDLEKDVKNINLGKDLYADLGVDKTATGAVIDTAYRQKIAALANATSTDAQTQRQTIVYAHGVLSNPNTRALYDGTQIEPTVFPRVIGSTLYIYIDKISPTTLQEFGFAVDQASTTPKLSSLIIDVRQNVGGDLSFASSFLGLFIGQNQYAFDLFHQDNYEVQRTTIGAFPDLARYKEIAVLTDDMTQSTAELTAVTLKKYHLATIVGSKTRGWGSVENVLPLSTSIDPAQKYSLVLVTHLTLRDDNQPIESNGVVPDIDIADKNWKQEVDSTFRSSSLINAIKQTITVKPLEY